MTNEHLNKKIKYLVADTTAFLNAVPLNEYAENVLTVPDVITEVRNKRQIRRLCVLPFDLQVREPSVESVRHCVAFAKKTGDYASLSGIDLKVISLTYELEAEHVGTEHLRTEPVMAQTIASRDKPPEMLENTKLPGWYEPEPGAENSDNEYSDNESQEEQDEQKNINNEQNVSLDVEENEKKVVDNIKEDIEKKISGKCVDGESEKPDYTDEELDRAFEQLNCTDNGNYEDILQPEEHKTDVSSEEDNDDDKFKGESQELNDDGWITPSNIKHAKKCLEGKIEEDRIPIVACMSTDFALQNVLKQLNLNISALNGRVIKQLRTYILRCYACYKTTSIMTKVFCPKCGNKTLKRVAVSLDENGKQVIHINTRRPLTAKYKNQSIPHFRGGKHSRNPILFEDQPIPRQMPSRVAKTKTNSLDVDYIAGMSPFVMRDVDSKSAMLRAKGNLKEWARNNNFEEDRRRKNYNRLYK